MKLLIYLFDVHIYIYGSIQTVVPVCIYIYTYIIVNKLLLFFITITKIYVRSFMDPAWYTYYIYIQVWRVGLNLSWLSIRILYTWYAMYVYIYLHHISSFIYIHINWLSSVVQLRIDIQRYIMMAIPHAAAARSLGWSAGGLGCWWLGPLSGWRVHDDVLPS
jgi:hypothetical protein